MRLIFSFVTHYECGSVVAINRARLLFVGTGTHAVIWLAKVRTVYRGDAFYNLFEYLNIPGTVESS